MRIVGWLNMNIFFNFWDEGGALGGGGKRIYELKRCFLFLKRELYWLDFCPGDSFSTGSHMNTTRSLRRKVEEGGGRLRDIVELVSVEIVNICECCLNKKKKKEKEERTYTVVVLVVEEERKTSDFPTFCILAQHLFLVECWKSDYYVCVA
ncbi:hypothetical protein Tsp_06854 [Trichinella spiralis]|uniref:hypothetical protein n=1 Tax=Trichinella spiralis TaxID=6334 RepID=UPI0001EFC9DB|nr:hypothetical protein Tsp_06854 [Trichinella spiralis]